MPPRATRAVENSVQRLGYPRVAGVDEVGRGCLAGPVAVAAVVLDPRRPVPGLRDSKLLTAAQRERLSARICRDALAWRLVWAEPDEIDTVNIHQASLRAMARAVLALDPLPCAVLVDGFAIPGLPLPQRAIVGGDRHCAAIAAASIVAKVARDRLMESLHDADPRYGFDRHKGYATPEHLAAVSRHGYSSVHRRSFLCRAFHTPTLFDTIE
jgi:ribonuclease HII